MVHDVVLARDLLQLRRLSARKGLCRRRALAAPGAQVLSAAAAVPVYGLAMLAAGHLPPSCTEPFWRLVLYGGLTCTAVEYAVHFLYEKLLGVLFWDYSDTKLDLKPADLLSVRGGVGAAVGGGARWVQPVLWPLAASVPAGAGYAMLLLLICRRLLHRAHPPPQRGH